MNLEGFIALIGKLQHFDLQTVSQLCNEPRQTMRMQLYRWMKQGKLVSLRRGMYALGATYRKVHPNPAVLANQIYRPSYLSFHWALGYYGLIPEKVVLYTSATTRAPRRFENEFGHFRYFHIKTDFFLGYQTMKLDGQDVLVATPEKALLDLWHIEANEWSVERMASMRFQGLNLVSARKLRELADKSRSPRLMRAVQNWQAHVRTETEEEGKEL